MAFDLIPSLKETIERIYQVVNNNSLVKFECHSQDQLVGIIEQWAENLSDYNSLV